MEILPTRSSSGSVGTASTNFGNALRHSRIRDKAHQDLSRISYSPHYLPQPGLQAEPHFPFILTHPALNGPTSTECAGLLSSHAKAYLVTPKLGPPFSSSASQSARPSGMCTVSELCGNTCKECNIRQLLQNGRCCWSRLSYNEQV